MEAFARLIQDIEDAKEPEDKVKLLAQYFRSSRSEDAAWALKVMLDRPTKKLVPAILLKETSLLASGLPEWLFERSLSDVGDLAEAVALLLGPPAGGAGKGCKLSQWMDERVLPLAAMDVEQQSASLTESWFMLSPDARHIFNRLVLGLLKPAASREQVVGGFARSRRIPAWAIHLRLADSWTPSEKDYARLTSSILTDVEPHRPYRLCTAAESKTEVEVFGWHADLKWDGVRVQAIRRGGKNSLWLKSESLVTERFPEICDEMQSLPDGTVLDGVIVGWQNDHPTSATEVQSRLERISKSRASSSVIYIAFDILEHRGQDIRMKPLQERRALLGGLRTAIVPPLLKRFEHPYLSALGDSIFMTEHVRAQSLSTLVEEAHLRGAHGVVMKRLDSWYGSTHEHDTWVVAKSESKSLNGVLMYVERGAGGQIEQLTVGVWKEEELVPIAKVPNTLTPEESASVEAFVKENTLERFGPVRTVRPGVLMELRYESAEKAGRRKSGLVLRHPRITQLRLDLDASEAALLSDIDCALA